jgi:rubrerythrin
MRKHIKAGFGMAAVLCALLLCARPAWCTGVETSQKVGTTLENLNAAYNGESNAQARYTAFAKKAQEEGYLKVASLFRAAAKSEEIHAANHAKVIKQMGGASKATIEAPVVKSTKENLEAALAGESHERDSMYPAFIAQAEKDKNKAAVKTFTEAKGVEANHAKLYTAALANLEAWKVGGVVFSDCGECGNTVEKVDFVKCPVCGEPRSRYFEVK